MEEWENAVRITSFDDPRIDPYARLTSAQMRSKYEPEKGIFIAEAETVIEVALDAGICPLSVLFDGEMLSDRGRAVIARCRKIHPETELLCASREVMKSLTGFELTRGILCAMKRPRSADAEALIADARRVAVLEGISDSTNIGAIMRGAAGIGIDAVILTDSCADPLLRRSVRVSMGTVFKVKWAYIGNARQATELLKRAGFLTVALALRKDALPISDERFHGAGKCALYFGAEGDGLKPDTIDACDYTAIIPMKNGVDSLNVAAAAAVAFWEIRERE